MGPSVYNLVRRYCTIHEQMLISTVDLFCMVYVVDVEKIHSDSSGSGPNIEQGKCNNGKGEGGNPKYFSEK